MSDQEQINVSMRTTKIGWDHIVRLIQKDTDPAWSQFNAAFIEIIQDTVNRSVSSNANSRGFEPEPDYEYDNETPESQGYHIGDDGRYYPEDHFNETYGGYANYRRLSDEAGDLGFPDAESYQSWLDD